MSFLYASLLSIGLPLLAAPLVIHLINLRRQKKIRWAAMQFLIDSEKQNKRWILFKQWLLLATRMAAIGLLVLLLAHVVIRNEWLRLLGSGTTHHVLLVDDSYSVGDRWESTSALGEAKRATGDRPGALAAFERALALETPNRGIVSFAVATLHAEAGDDERALAALVAMKPWLRFFRPPLETDPAFARLRADPRLADLLATVPAAPR